MARSFLSSIDPNAAPKTFSKWQELRRSNPRLYYAASAQTKIASDLKDLGSDKFFGKGDQS